MESIKTDNAYFGGECKFIIGANKIEQIPPTNCPEVAFIGRSNVGKSSLINAIVNRNALARVSQTPGCTRQINFFSIADKFNLVDLPGYGYAKASKADRAAFNVLVLQYLRSRRELKRIFLLVDSRHEIKSSDIEMMDFLDNTANIYQLVLTKIDKAKKSDLVNNLALIEKLITKHAACHPELILTSSETKEGIGNLKNVIKTLLCA